MTAFELTKTGEPELDNHGDALLKLGLFVLENMPENRVAEANRLLGTVATTWQALTAARCAQLEQETRRIERRIQERSSVWHRRN